MLLGAGLFVLGAALLYYAVTGTDPRDLVGGQHARAPWAAGSQTRPAPTPIPKTSGGTPAANRVLGRAMAAAYGWVGREWRCLDSLWTRESGWNHRARNPSSGAAGIPQVLPSAHPGVVDAAFMRNPAAQIAWGLRYIRGRYGSPCQAWAHSQSTGWY